MIGGISPKESTMSRSRYWLLSSFTLAFVATGTFAATRIRHRKHAAPIPAPPKPKLFSPIVSPELQWSLQGGLVSGNFLDAKARQEWPLWMQALIDHRSDVSLQDLREADLYKIPDVHLNQAVVRLTERGVFTPRLIRQVSAIGYTAQAAEWIPIRTAYQVAYLKQCPLPVDDALTTSRLITELAMNGERESVRAALNQTPFPADDRKTQAAFLRVLSGEGALREQVLDTSKPSWERLHGLVMLKKPGDAERLLASLRGTEHLDQAVFHALSKDWISLSNPLVDDAIKLQRKPDDTKPWFMIRPQERVSDLLWMRSADALANGEKRKAADYARTLVNRYPRSWYAGHAASLLAAVDSGFQRPNAALRVPADLTVFNADGLCSTLPRETAPWPETLRADAERKRFDLALAHSNPEKDPDGFLRAAHAAGQQDLVGRFMACERSCTPAQAVYLYPTALVPLVARLIKEEGLEGQVDPAFVLAMIKNESVFQPTARSGANAYGIMQLLIPTFRHMADPGDNILDPEANIRAGIRYYRTIIRTAHLQNLPMEARLCYVLAGYHAGEGRAKKWREASETTLGGKTETLAMVQRIEGVSINSTRQYVTRGIGDWKVFRQLMSNRMEPGS